MAMREIGTLVPSTEDNVAGSDFGLPGFAPRRREEPDDEGDEARTDPT